MQLCSYTVEFDFPYTIAPVQIDVKFIPYKLSILNLLFYPKHTKLPLFSDKVSFVSIFVKFRILSDSAWIIPPLLALTSVKSIFELEIKLN